MTTLRTYNSTVSSFSPLLHLRLNEAAGTTAFDSADDLDGEYRGGFTLRADGPIGNGAVGLDGSTGYVFVPHQDQLLLSSGSFEVWFTADVVSGTHNLFGKNSEGQGTGGQVAMAVRDGEILAAIGDTSTNFSVHGGTVAAGASTQAVLTFGAEGMQLYVNGEEVDTNSHTGGLDGNFEPLVIGAESGFSTPGTVDDLQRFFQGAIDEFAVYDRALTGDEIRALFEAGELGGRLVGTAAADTLIGGSDAEDLRGAGGNDLIRGNGDDDDLLGGGGADRLLGGTGNDHLFGGGGKDTLSGGGGADELFGGRGVDIMRGGAGDDLLNGGPGRDRLAGGAGGDTFQIDRISHGVDRIRGFEDGAGGDILDLGAVLDFGDGDDVDGFVRLVEVHGSSRIEVDANGGGDNFTAGFNLLGVTGLDLATLVADGNVQLGPPPAS